MGSHQAITFLLVFIGGGIGSMLRHAANLIGASVLGLTFPFPLTTTSSGLSQWDYLRAGLLSVDTATS